MAKNRKSKTDITKKTDEDKMIIYAFAILILIMVLVWALKKGSSNDYNSAPIPTQQVQNSYPSINSSNDLDKAAIELDKTDLNGIDKELNGLSTDSSGF